MNETALGPEMVQLFFEPVVCTWDAVLSVLKDLLLLAGQRVCSFWLLLMHCCFLPQSYVPEKRFVAQNRS